MENVQSRVNAFHVGNHTDYGALVSNKWKYKKKIDWGYDIWK